MSQFFLSPLFGCFSPGNINFFSSFSGIRQNYHPVRTHFQKTSADRQRIFFSGFSGN